MLKAAIFDLDGLLIDSEVISLAVYQRMVQEHGGDLTTAVYAQQYSGRSGILNMQTLIEQFALPIDLDAGLKESAMLEKQLMRHGVPLKPGAHTLLAYLKVNGYQIALASSSTPQRAHAILAANGIEHYFDSFTFRDDVNESKPHPAIFLKACEKLGLVPAEGVVLEDSEAGIQAAHAAQIPVICIPDMRQPSAPYAVMTAGIYKSLDAAIDYFKTVADEVY